MVGGDILRRVLASSWGKSCAMPEQLDAVVQPVRDAFGRLTVPTFAAAFLAISLRRLVLIRGQVVNLASGYPADHDGNASFGPSGFRPCQPKSERQLSGQSPEPLSAKMLVAALRRGLRQPRRLGCYRALMGFAAADSPRRKFSGPWFAFEPNPDCPTS
jgi:hypothetical protein